MSDALCRSFGRQLRDAADEFGALGQPRRNLLPLAVAALRKFGSYVRTYVRMYFAFVRTKHSKCLRSKFSFS